MIKRIYGSLTAILIIISMCFPSVLPMTTADYIKVIALMIATDIAISKED